MKHRRHIAIALLAVAAILAGALIYRGTSRTRFLRDLDRIAVGMTAAEVEQIMAGYIKGRGAKWQIPPAAVGAPPVMPDPTPTGDPQFSGSITYRHSHASRHDSDWGVVKFRAGRVVTVQFMPD